MNNNDEVEIEFGDQPEKKDELIPEKPAEPKTEAKNSILSDSINFTEQKTGMNYRLFMPSYPRDFLTSLLVKAKEDPDVNVNAKELVEWGEVVKESINMMTPGLLYQDRFRDPNSLWRQGVLKEDQTLATITHPRLKSATGDLKGEAAILKVSKALGLGDTLTIPLPHSGIVVTIKPPKERDIIDFYNSVFREKIWLGRMTAGLTLTNMSVYMNNRLFNFILKHVHSINLKDVPKEQLGNYMLMHDFPILAWGFAATQYPNGFDYKRACSNDLKKCSHIEQGVINMLKLLWIDNTQLSEIQKAILTDYRPNNQDVEQYRKYISEHSRVRPKDYVLSNGIKIRMKVPTFNEHIADGMAWVNKINSDIDMLVTESDVEEQAKTELLMQYVNTSMLRQFSHFVDYIELNKIGSEGDIITDRDTINSTLELLSSDDDIRPQLANQFLDFKSFSTIALIGIPSYDCPACKEPQNTEPVNDNLVSVIPLDVISVFFTLLTLRLSRILERE